MLRRCWAHPAAQSTRAGAASEGRRACSAVASPHNLKVALGLVSACHTPPRTACDAPPAATQRDAGYHPFEARAAPLRGEGCTPMWQGLQPYVARAATLCGEGCNPMWRGLQPYAARQSSSASSVSAEPKSTWRFVEIRGDPWRFVEIAGNPWRWLGIRGDCWRCVEIAGDVWRLLEIRGDCLVFVWRLVEIAADCWRLLGVRGDY